MIEDESIELEELKLYHEWPRLHNETEWLNRAKKAHQLALEFDWDVLLTHLFSDLFKTSNHDLLNK